MTFIHIAPIIHKNYNFTTKKKVIELYEFKRQACETDFNDTLLNRRKSVIGRI